MRRPSRHLSPARIAAISISMALHVGALLVLTLPGAAPPPSASDNAPMGEPWVVEIASSPPASSPTPTPPAPVVEPLAKVVPEAPLPKEEPVSSPPAPQAPPMEGFDPSTLYEALGMEQPVESVRAGQDSQVWVVVTINTAGAPVSVTLDAGANPIDPQLEEAARSYILKSWHFQPTPQPTVLRLPLVYL